MKPSNLFDWLRDIQREFLTFAKRLPKNLRSNRWWIVWNRTLYLSSTTHLLRNQVQLKNVGISIDTLPCYSHWKLLINRQRVVGPSNQGLFLPEMGRFGNMTRRLALALALSQATGIEHVVVPPSAEFESEVFKRGIHQYSGHRSIWLFAEDHLRNKSVKILHKFEALSTGITPIQALRESSHSAWEQLSRLLIEPIGPSLGAGHVVIHIRGGDVFGPRKPASYGQPPLSYYTLVLGLEQWRKVTLVTGDGENPVTYPLVEWCKTRELPVTVQAGSLTEDLSYLLRAQTLVAGRGTFMPAVCGLSRNAKKVYFFENKFTLVPPVHGLTTIRVVDKEGSYAREILNNNWQNSDAQRALMLSYPERNLSLDL